MNTKITLGNRILSVFLMLIMVLSMLPLSVFATDDVHDHTASTATDDGHDHAAQAASEDYAAEVTIGSTTTPYSDLAAAFNAATGNVATVKLLNDFDSFSTTTITGGVYGMQFSSGDITLDLNGHYIRKYSSQEGSNANKKAVFYVTGSAKLTVIDSVGGGEIVQPTTDPALIVDSNASLTVRDGKINGVKSIGIRVDSGTLTVEGGTIESHGAGICVGGGTVTVTGTPKIHGKSSNALLITAESTVTLSGGTYTTNENDKHSIWTTVGKVEDLLAEGFRYTDANGIDIAITEDGHGTDSDNVTVSDFGIKYIDADGNEQICTDFTELTESTNGSTGLEGWYVVKGTVNIKGSIGVTNGKTLNLILCEGATLNLKDTLYTLGTATLNIYGQSGGTGTLIARTTTSQPGIGVMHSTANSNATVNIYGGTVTAQATDGAQPIGIHPVLMPKAKVSVNIAKGMKCVKTDDQNTPYAYDNIDGTSITITKCTEHKWLYTNITDSTHDQTCDLCGTAEAGVAHTMASYKYVRTDIHSLICACGKGYSSEHHTYTYAPNSDGLTHTATCKCGYAVDDIMPMKAIC